MKTLKQKNSKKNNNFNCYLPVFWGFYGSHWDEPDFYGEAENFNLPKNFEFWQYVKWDDYKNDLSKKFCQAVQAELSEYIKKVDFLDLDSPKYYNFDNDKISINVTIDKKKIKKYIYENLESFEEYLKQHHKSRDGFCSFYSHTFEDWKKYTANFTDYTKEGYVCLTSILRFISEQEQITEDCLYEAGNEIYISNYYNDEFNDILQLMQQTEQNEFVSTDKVNEFLSKKYNDKDDIKNLNEVINNIIILTQENYLNNDILTLVQEKFNEDTHTVISEEIISVEAIVEATISKIESSNLKLEL